MGDEGARGADGLTDIERVVARDEIRQLAYRYAWAVDTRDLDALVGLFVPDVRVTRETSGAEAFRAFWQDSLRAIGVSILFVGNHVIDFTGADHATGLVYCRCYLEPRDGPHPGRFVEQAILYRDTYERRDGRWLFVKRKHELWYGIETAERPLEQRVAAWPVHHDGLGTVPYDEPSWRAFWGDAAGPLGTAPAS
jgi:ketosteroid isomerase-like protein